MRNLFDQYTQPENKLTHAIVCCLGEDPRLLRAFVKWVTESTPPKNLQIVEQRLPGELELEAETAEKLGIPDAWIHDGDSWSLLIESKIASPLKNDQLIRHLRTAKRRGFDQVTLLAIDVIDPKQPLPREVHFRKWRNIYSWLSSHAGSSDWARRAMQYFEVIERKWPAGGYLKEGTLTEFTGIHFNQNNPYNYGEAKRLLRLMLERLRDNKLLASIVNVDAPGRGAITGKGQNVVWDFLRLKGTETSDKHTSQPHISPALLDDRLIAIVNFPNNLGAEYKRRLAGLSEEEFRSVLAEINENMKKVIRSTPGAYPFARIMQRRYPSQRSKPFRDGLLEFDLRTAFPGGKGQSVKLQEQWLDALYSLIHGKKSNLEWAVGMGFPYESCPKTRTTEIIDSLAECWLACRPLLDVMLGRSKGL